MVVQILYHGFNTWATVLNWFFCFALFCGYLSVFLVSFFACGSAWLRGVCLNFEGPTVNFLISIRFRCWSGHSWVNKTEEIEDLQLEIEGFASYLDKEELYSVCEKLKIEQADFFGKSRFTTVRILTKGIEKLLDKLKDEERWCFWNKLWKR